MAVGYDQLKPLSFKAGINNRTEETAAPAGTARALINLDLAPGGVPITRQGFTLRVPLVGCHSLWSHEALAFGLYVLDDQLLQLHATLQSTVLRTGLARRKMHYAYVAGKVYYSNGIDTGTVSLAGSDAPWGVETPTPTYQAVPAADGGMDGGDYQIALTYLAGREESAAAAPLFVTLAPGQGIALSNLPQPHDSGITALRIYVSATNDPRLLHARDVPVGMTAVTIVAGQRGRRLDTLFLRQATPGQYLLPNNGRIYSASGKLLRWTEALRYGLTDPANNYRVMPAPIVGIGAPESQGLILYIGTADKVYQLQGEDIEDAKLVAVGHTGMVPGSLIDVGAEALGLANVTAPCPVWIGTNGQFYVGTAFGILPLAKGAAATVYRQAAATVLERDGAQRLLVAGTGGKLPGLAMRDKAVARVVA